MKRNTIINTLIALVWLINGLFCKVLNLVPRHQDIVLEITSFSSSKELTTLIGVLEIIMAFWILSKVKQKLNTILQIIVIAMMNIIEFIMVPHLLLWGKLNIVFALILIAIIYLNNFNSKTRHYAFNS